MNNYDIASELSYLVLEKQRRDPEVALSPLHKPVQIRESRLDVDQLFCADEVIRDEEVPTWHVHGRKGKR